MPIVLAAEAFEDQKAGPPNGLDTVAPPHPHAGGSAHDHEEAHEKADESARQPWSPTDGAERTFWTWVAGVLHAFGVALLALVALASRAWLRGGDAARWRLALGLAAAGWLSLHLWPSLGLPAEIPGMDAARLGSRQAWWLLAAGSAAAACAGVVFGRRRWRWAVAAVWLAVPYAVGAPEVAGDPLAGFAPDVQAVLRDLGHRFIVVTHALAAAFWLALGAACAWAFARWVRPALDAVRGNATSPMPALRRTGSGS
jgi:cobalt transporter subunit CbtA